MTRDLVTSILAAGAMLLASSSVSSLQQTPGNETSANASAGTPVDPAAAVFATDTGLVLHAIKPSNAADYEAVITALQGALARAEDADTRAVAAGWRVYKAAESETKSYTLYVHVLKPTAAGVDYRPSLWLDTLLAGAPADLLARYREAFASPPTQLSLTEFADMTVAPPPSNATPPVPSNGTPPAPSNGTPDAPSAAAPRKN